MTDPMLTPLTNLGLRDRLEQMILTELLGPASPDEELKDEHVSNRYLVGILYPRGVETRREELDPVALAGSDSQDDGKADSGSQTTTMFQSSFGFTFTVSDKEAQAIRVSASWGHYDRREPVSTVRDEKGYPRLVWKRTAVTWSADVPLVAGKTTLAYPNKEGEDYHVGIEGIIRPMGADWIITLFLVNNEPPRNHDSHLLFQPELQVTAVDGRPIFKRQQLLRAGDKLDSSVLADEREMEMLYRKHVEFARGHGVGVHCETEPGEPTCARLIKTVVAPVQTVRRVTPPTVAEIPALQGLALDMKVLAEAEAAALPGLLRPLADAYEGWIAEQAARLTSDDPKDADLKSHKATATDALANCRRALTRLRAGIDLLASNQQAATAFSFLNRAMWQQRVHTIMADNRRRGKAATEAEVDIPRNHEWRPFQLAFILLNLPGVTDLGHDDRRASEDAIADLLWFPTGGGKTEAYLGLTAYTLAIRRLQGVIEGRSGAEGVSVLMRYTLRLLTIQQFQRAAALICACEQIRRDDPARWGATPFRLGLWVGMKTTPNHTKDAEDSIKQARNSGWGGGTGSPAQLTNCPWCGTKIEAGKDYAVDKTLSRTFTYCPSRECAFNKLNSEGEGLPVLVVDDEIYRLLPSLLISTVDKFAQMPWNGETAQLFGQVDVRCQRHGFKSPESKVCELSSGYHPASNGHPQARLQPSQPLRPPDLIIQDELHLISGPLGTLVGLYETAIDSLSSWTVAGKKVRPKVIASTATIRRSRDQMHALFLRQVEVFPPSGLDVEDNFFARAREVSEQEPGRRYLGICAQGRRLKVALIRVYFACMAAAQTLYEREGYSRRADPWMTLVGYFNSMRELGSMRRLVDDDVRSQLERAGERGLARRRISEQSVEELTSRKSSTDIPAVLDRLETPFDLEEEAARKERIKQKLPVRGYRPYDVLLATNMISVGVDVQRLGLMVVAGQPKTTAEYIQATSRVGRNSPGLICTVFNWSRPRDLSHYEQFEHYHDTFYKYVETTSVTPFSSRALDRGLSGLLVSSVRLMGMEFNPNDGARRIQRQHSYITSTLQAIMARAASIGGVKVGAQVKLEVEERLDNWLHRIRSSASKGTTLAYDQKNKDGTSIRLLHRPGEGKWDLFTCMMSLRDVEPEIGLILDRNGVPPDENRTLTTNAAERNRKADQGEDEE